MLAASGQMSLGGSTVGRSLNRELAVADAAQITMNDTSVRFMANLTTDASTISLSNFYQRVHFRKKAQPPLIDGYPTLWNWTAPSSTGQYVYFVDGRNLSYHRSTDYATTYSTLGSFSGLGFRTIACSGTGAVVVYILGDGIYVSTNYGVNFTKRLTATFSTSDLSISDNGALMIACSYSSSVASQLYVSTNSGTNWTARGPSSTYWDSVACSGTSTYMYALNTGPTNGYIWRSSDSGTNWTKIRTAKASYFVTCSTNGSIVWTVDNVDTATRGIAKSTDYGANWTIVGPFSSKSNPIECSSDGSKLVANRNAMTWDGGATWQTYMLDIGGNIRGAVTRDGTLAMCHYNGDNGGYTGVAYLYNL